MIEWSQVPGFLKLLNPAGLWRWFRQKIAPKEPPPPTKCRNCGTIGAMTLGSTAFRDGQVVEFWTCDKCSAPRLVAFPRH